MPRRNDHWMRGTRVYKDPIGSLTTATFVITLGLVVGTVMSLGPVNSWHRLTQGVKDAVGFVRYITNPPNKISVNPSQLADSQ